MKHAILYCLFLAFAGCVAPIRDNLAQPPERKHLVGNWAGQDPNGMNLLYLVLEENGEGVIGDLYERKDVKTDAINWDVNGRVITVKMRSNDSANSNLSIYGEVRGNHILLRLRNNGQQRAILFTMDEDLQRSLATLREATKQIGEQYEVRKQTR